jgi:hypothetical protein
MCPHNQLIESSTEVGQMEGLDPRFSLFLYNKEMTAPEPRTLSLVIKRVRFE